MIRFCLIYRIWAFQAVRAIGPWDEWTWLSFGAGAMGPGVSMSLHFSWAWLVGLRAYFLNLMSIENSNTNPLYVYF